MKKLILLIITLCILITTVYAYNLTTIVNGNKLIATINDGEVVTVTYTDIAGYTFSNWTVTGITLANPASKEITLTMPKNDVTIEPNIGVTSSTVYTITYNLDGGSATNPTSYTSDDTIILNAPTKEGYIFSGWTGSNGTTPETNVTISVGNSGDKEYTANWTISTNIAYTVNHWQQTVNGGTTQNSSNYSLKETENKTGTFGESVTPAVKTYTGFTSPSTQTVTILADGSAVVNYYYTRNSYTITLNANGGSCSTSTITVKYGGTYSGLPSATRETYSFVGWYTATTNGSKISTTTQVSTTSNQTLYAIWYCDGTGYTCTTSECSGGYYTCNTCGGAGGSYVDSTDPCLTCNCTGGPVACNGTFELISESDCEYCDYGWGWEGFKCDTCGAVYHKCINCEMSDGGEHHYTLDTCYDCNGRGSVSSRNWEDCSVCNGNCDVDFEYCSHGYSGSHNYCSHYNYIDETSHTYCIHGYSSPHN